MKIFTKYLLYFMAAMAIYTLIFRIGLSYFLNQQMFLWLGLSGFLYGASIFFTAFFLGKADGQKNPFFDIGLRFHISSYLIWAAVSFGWFYLGNPSQWEHVMGILRIMIYWGMVLIFHVIAFLILRKDTIRGIHKSELFN